MSKKQVTVKDIASELGLHYTTVSKALRNHPDIKSVTRQRVRKLADKLDYYPNSIAQNLKRQKSYTIGLIVPTIKNDFFASVVSGLEDVAYQKGYSTIVCQSNERYEQEVLYLRTLTSNRVAAIAVSVAGETESGMHFNDVLERGIPLVFFDRYCQDVKADRVVVSDYEGALDAVELLIRSGRKRIAHFAGPQNVSVARERFRGYEDALRKNNRKIDNGLIFYGGFDVGDGVNSFEKLIDMDCMPDAIFAVNDPVAIGAYTKIKEKGLKIPDDIALIGFGDNILASYTEPQLTTVKQSPYEIGRATADLILKRIEKNKGKDNEQIKVIETELIIRGSI